MKLVIFAALVGTVLGDRLENTYLPPSSARTAGGSGNFLSAPRSSFGPSSHSSSLDRSSFGRIGTTGSGFGSGSAFGRSSSFGGSGFGSQGSGFGSQGSGFGSHGSGFGSHGSGFGGQGAQAPSTSYGAPQARFGGFGNSGSGYHGGQQIPILKFNNDNDGFGGYRYEYETGNGIRANEVGQHGNAQGSYSYTGDDGRQYTVHYTADENGFRAQGDHLPTPPPIPDAILKSLQYNAQHGGSDRHNSGRYDGSSGLEGISVEAASRQYLAPRQPSFSRNSGYHY